MKKTKNIKYMIVGLLVAIFLIPLIPVNNVVPTKIYAETNTIINNTTVKQKNLKILAIRIDPTLTTQGNVTASAFLGTGGNGAYFRDYQTVKREYLGQFNYMTNGVVSATVVKEEVLNEFPTYNKQVKRFDNSMAYSLDEKSWLEMFAKETSTRGKYAPNTDNRFNTDIGKQFSTFRDGDLNTSYLVQKYNLVQRKNNGEFDVVWIVANGDAYPFESCIVGNNNYFCNGTGIYGDCPNFLFCAVNLLRSETYLECLGHAMEYTLGLIFNNTAMSEIPSVSTQTEFDNLNTWNKFRQYDKLSSGFSVAGNVHFAPNSEIDYKWENTNYVYSTWQDWKMNYPNLSPVATAKKQSNCNDWKNLNTYDSQNANFMQNLSHKKWWMSIMPHVAGRDSLGYSNNWWDYGTEFDWVTKIENTSNETITLLKGQSPAITYNITYKSGKKAIYEMDKICQNVKVIVGNDVLEIVDGKLVAKKTGSATIQTYFDGVYTITNFVIPEQYTLSFNVNGGSGRSVSLGTVNLTDKFVVPTESSSGMSKAGHTLNNWKIEGTNSYLEPGTTYLMSYVVEVTNGLKTINLLAQWEINSFEVLFYDSDGETVLYTETRTYNDRVQVADFTADKKDTEKYDYEFIGWFKSPTKGGQQVEDFNVEGNVKLYAHYKETRLYDFETENSMYLLGICFGVICVAIIIIILTKIKKQKETDAYERKYRYLNNGKDDDIYGPLPTSLESQKYNSQINSKNGKGKNQSSNSLYGEISEFHLDDDDII